MDIDNTKNVEEYVMKSSRSEQVRKVFTYKNIDPTSDIRQAIKQASGQSLRYFQLNSRVIFIVDYINHTFVDSK